MSRENIHISGVETPEEQPVPDAFQAKEGVFDETSGAFESKETGTGTQAIGELAAGYVASQRSENGDFSTVTPEHVNNVFNLMEGTENLSQEGRDTLMADIHNSLQAQIGS